MLNQVTIIGRLGADPELREITGGTKVVTVSVASWESYFDKSKPNDQGGVGAWETITEWHRVVIWGDAAERTKKMKKGEIVVVTGKNRTRSWEKDGITHYQTEIVGFMKSFPKSDGKTSPNYESPVTQQGQNVQDPGGDFSQPVEDDLPF